MRARAVRVRKTVRHCGDEKLRGEGFGDDRLDALLLADPVSWGGLVAQCAGGPHRRREGKDEAAGCDCVGVKMRMLDRMYRKRLKECAAQGYKLRPAGDEGDVRGEFVTQEEYRVP